LNAKPVSELPASGEMAASSMMHFLYSWMNPK
jgi:hypothetical protein